MTDYVPINTGAAKPKGDLLPKIELEVEKPVKDESVEIENISVENALPLPEPVEEIEVQSGEELPPVLEEEVEKPKKAKRKKPSRAEKRIKELHSKGKEKDDEITKLKQILFEKDKQASVNTKEANESLQKTLEGQVTALNAKLVSAMEQGEHDQVVSTQQALMETNLKLAETNYNLKNHEEVPDEMPTEHTPQAASATPEQALDWIEEHPEFKTDELFYVNAMTINNQLVNEGFDANKDEFYEELDTRMERVFPDLFGIDEESSVQLEAQQEETTPSAEQKTKKSSSKSKPKQTVSGASRTPSGSPTKASKKSNSVKLSVEDQKIAQKWNMTKEQMARRMLHMEKNRGEDGYTPISIPKK